MPNLPLPGARWLIDLMPIWYHHVNLAGAYGHGLITHCFPMADYKEAIRVATSKGREEAIEAMFKHA